MTAPSTRPAIVLFAHGSRDPLWRAPIEAVAERIRTLAPGAAVACAYLEYTEPTLETVVAQLAGSGATAIAVWPMFLGTGRHARDDLPRLVDFYLRGLLDLDTIIAERIPLEKINEGFEKLEGGHSARSVVVFD